MTLSRSVLAASLAALGLASTADAGSIDFNLSVGTIVQPRTVYVEPEIRVVQERVWVEPVYRTVIDRIWVEPVIAQRTETVFVPDRYETRIVRYRDDCGVWITRTERVLVEPAHYETVVRPIVVREGFWEEHERRELVRDGHWEIRERQVVVREGYYRPVGFRVNVGDRFDFRGDRRDDDRRSDIDFRRDDVRFDRGDFDFRRNDVNFDRGDIRFRRDDVKFDRNEIDFGRTVSDRAPENRGDVHDARDVSRSDPRTDRGHSRSGDRDSGNSRPSTGDRGDRYR